MITPGRSSSASRSRAEDDLVVGSGWAGECAGGVVLWVAVRVGTLPLEVPRVLGRPAVVGRRSDAAVDVLLEHGARVVAHPVLPQLGGAPRVHVDGAPRAAAAPGPAVGEEAHGHVEAVDEGDVEEVEVVELLQRVLRQRVGGAPVPRALQHAAAVARAAAPAPARVELAARARPDARRRRARGGRDPPRLAAVQPPTAAHRHGRGPHGVGAPVHHREHRRVAGYGEEGEGGEEAAADGRHGRRSCHFVGELMQPKVCRERSVCGGVLWIRVQAHGFIVWMDWMTLQNRIGIRCGKKNQRWWTGKCHAEIVHVRTCMCIVGGY